MTEKMFTGYNAARAYNETYLYDSMEILGEAVDFAVNDLNIPIKDFFDMFIVSGVAAQFGSGVPKYVAGMSGEELVLDIIGIAGLDMAVKEPVKHYGRSPEYWVGWILAYYQWYVGRPFSTIFKSLSPERVLSLYPVLHEASEDKCVDTFNNIIRKGTGVSRDTLTMQLRSKKKPASKLQYQRMIRGLSQKELAEIAGINLRTLQQYEIKTKNINKAAVDTVYNLARVLGCQIENLMELELHDVEPW